MPSKLKLIIIRNVDSNNVDLQPPGLPGGAAGPDPKHPNGGLQPRTTGGLSDGDCPRSKVIV